MSAKIDEITIEKFLHTVRAAGKEGVERHKVNRILAVGNKKRDAIIAGMVQAELVRYVSGRVISRPPPPNHDDAVERAADLAWSFYVPKDGKP